MHILAIANQKGGVGKTTLAFHLSHALSSEGYKVLAVDLDPQRNLSLVFGVRDLNLAEKIFTKNPKIEWREISPNLSLISSDVTLSQIENKGFNLSLATHLKKALSSVDNFDFVIIDCPPSLGVLTVNAFLAADYILVPVAPAFFSYTATKDLLEVVEGIVEDGFNPKLKVVGFVFNMCFRGKAEEEAEKHLREAHGDMVFQTKIPRSVKVEEAIQFSMPLFSHLSWHPAGQAFLELTKELIKKLDNKGGSK